MFEREILQDLKAQGYEGIELKAKFYEYKKKIRPAVENLIADTDAYASEFMNDYKDLTDEIFKEN